MATDEDLDDFLRWAADAGHLPVSEEAMRRPAFGIDSDALAVWALRLVERAEAKVRARQQTMLVEVEQLEAWIAEAQRQALHVRAWVEGHLEDYLRRLQDEGMLGREKGWSLPGGRRLQWRKTPVEYTISDPDAFLSWCRARGLVRETPRWGEARQQFRPVAEAAQPGQAATSDALDPDTGELRVAVVPGVTIARLAQDRFTVKLAEEPAAPVRPQTGGTGAGEKERNASATHD